MRTRAATKSSGRYAINGTPLRFFHFSGFNPRTPSLLSNHQDQVDLRDFGLISEILDDYAQDLLSQGYEESREWRCAYSSYEDGTPIPDVARRVLVQQNTLSESVSDPFSSEGSTTVHEVWNQLATSAGESHSMTGLARHIHSLEPELRAAMPDPFGGHWNQFLQWIVDTGSIEYGLTPDLVNPLRDLLAERDVGVSQSNLDSPRFTTLAMHLYESRVDLRNRFPEIGQRDALGYLSWLLTYGAKEHRLDDENRALRYRVRRTVHGLRARRIRI